MQKKCCKNYDGPGGCLFHLVGLTALVLAMIFSAAMISIPIGLGHKVIEVESKKAEARIKAEEIRRQKELEELYKARPEWGFKPK